MDCFPARTDGAGRLSRTVHHGVRHRQVICWGCCLSVLDLHGNQFMLLILHNDNYPTIGMNAVSTLRKTRGKVPRWEKANS